MNGDRAGRKMEGGGGGRDNGIVCHLSFALCEILVVTPKSKSKPIRRKPPSQGVGDPPRRVP